MLRKLIPALLAAGLLSGAAGAAQAADKIALVVSTLNNPFFVTLENGAKDKAKELGYDLIVLDSQNDPAKELANVEDVLNQSIKALLLNPADSDAAKASVRAAIAKNVPVLTLDRAANGVTVASHIASDNVAGGKMAGDLIAQKLGGKGNVVELQGVPGTSAARDRSKGFMEAMAAAPGLKVVASQTANFDRTQGLNVMENILQAHPDIDAVFAANDEMALGAIKAIQAANRKIVVVGFDGTDDGVAAVKSGAMFASIAQQPALIGSLGVEAADKVIKGQTVPASTPVPLTVIKQ
ncbi:MAG: ribose ABC transporter substrate-binding protein RbsB [Roseiarcus sp.]|jgi:ribose transport system substrate-binding protein